MIVPAAMNIYSGAAMLREENTNLLEMQRKELAFALPTLRKEYAVAETFESGYALGLAVARAIIAASAEVMLKGAKPDNIL